MSLRRRLVVAISLLLTALGLLGASFAWHLAMAEVWDILDLQQRQVARLVGDGRALASPDPGPASQAGEGYAVEITGPAGRFASDPGLRFPDDAPPGFSDFTDQGEHWRLLSQAEGDRMVRIAQRIAERNTLAADAAWSTAIPFLAAIPLSWLVVYGLVGRIMQQVRQIAGAVDARPLGETAPVELAAVPVEMQPLIAAMNRALARLRAALTHEQAFVSDAAHALRTPLAALALQIGNLAHANRDPALAPRIAAVADGARRATVLTAQLLQLARQEAGAAAPAAPVDLAELVLAALATHAPLAAARGVDLGLTTLCPGRVPGHAADLAVLLDVLIDNAVRATPAGGTVDLALAPRGAGVTLGVHDTGPGIPPDELPRVFDRFYRGSAGTGEGNGLGLAIAQVIARRHGADLRLANRRDGPGLAAELVFPGPPSPA